MDIGEVKPREITEEMSDSYIDYAMSVIVSRALPDVRDGLKPVHRRILYVMHEMGLRSGGKFKKSANVVGEVLGKYHPHGDTSVYDAMVRMAQDFSLRYPLVNGQGNFGSMDGDSPAAYRYTEAKMNKLSEEMLEGVHKETVDWAPNYDGSKEEPKVLPASFPQLLANGSVGIAVGMATSIPPHNLIEIINAAVHLIDNSKATTEDIVKFIKGPDFPTGGAIFNKKDILQAYATGKGPIVARGSAEVVEGEEKKKSDLQIIVSEIPFQVNKANLLENIANLVKNKKIEGIKDIRDESDKDGVRVVIDLKNDAFPQKILNKLWKLTDLQKTFHMNMIALVDGIQPQVLSLKSVLELYLDHHKEIVERRSRYELKKAEERAHILEGLSKALDQIDKVIETIKKSKTKEEAHLNLMKKFSLSDIQSRAILDMRLQTLAGLERKKINDELKEKKDLIKKLKDLLGSDKKLWGVVKKELEEIKDNYGDERRTTVYSQPVGDINEEDLVPEEEVIITLSRSGFIRRLAPSSWQAQRRGGQGKKGAKLSEEDMVEHLIVASTHDDILFFTSSGKVFKTKAYNIPSASRTAKGRALVNFLNISSKETITAIIPLKENTKEEKNKFLVMATRGGIIKKTSLDKFKNVRSGGLIAIGLKKEDELGWVRPSGGGDEIVLVSKKGQAIKFSEKDVRAMGRSASGVKGMKLKKDDEVVGMDVVSGDSKSNNSKLLVVTVKGYGKKTKLKSYKKQKRGGVGVKTIKITDKNGEIAGARVLAEDEEDLITVSRKGQVIRVSLGEVSNLGRTTQGVRIMKLKEGDKLTSITTL